VFVVDAATFVVSAALVASIRRPFGSGSTTQHPGVLAGFRVIVRERALRLLVGAGMASLVGIGIVGVVAYPLSLELGGGTEAYGAMTALLGGGGVVGAALAGRVLAVGPLRVLVTGFAAGAAGLVLAGAAPVLAVALGGMALAGAGRGLGDVAATTLLQARAADEVRSRVFAAEDGAAHVAFTVAALAGALIVVLTSARGAFAAAAACGLVAVVVATRIPREPDAAKTPTVRM
jgi:MFS family permease